MVPDKPQSIEIPYPKLASRSHGLFLSGTKSS